ncbi:hypothetical protein G9P44_000153 [Scheffersomyces stipitis]|nr:hypothetical protein G9P44_000153 [Scheffersomyces stipitis]
MRPTSKCLKVLGIGVDVVNTDRFRRLVSRDPRFLAKLTARILHPQHELPEFFRISDAENKVKFLAGSWASKEAVFKTLDISSQKQFQFKHWFRRYSEQGKPHICNDNYPQSEQEEFLLSISHDSNVLVASALRQQK